MSNFPGKGKVAVVKTTPETVLEDYHRLMELAGVEAALSDKNLQTGLKINIFRISGIFDNIPQIERYYSCQI